MESKRILRDGAHLFLGKSLGMSLGLINLMVLTRLLTKEEMGKYSLVIVIVSFLVTFGLNWTDNSVIRYGREEFVKYGRINQTFWARSAFFVPFLLLFSALLIILGDTVCQYIGLEKKFIPVIIFLFSLSGIFIAMNSLFRSTDNVKRLSVMEPLQKIVFLLGLTYCYIHSGSLYAILIALVFSLFFSTIVLIKLLNLSFFKPFVINREYLHKIWRFSWPFLIGAVGSYTINYIDMIVIKNYLGSVELGVYTIAYRGFEIVMSVLYIVSNVMSPIIVEYRTRNKTGRIVSYAKRSPYFVAAWGFIAFIVIMVSHWLVPLVFTEKYAQAVPSFKVLLIASIFLFQFIYALPLVVAFNFIRESQAVNILMAAINIVLDFALVPKMGIRGAAVGTLIAYAIGALALWLIIRFHWKKISIGELKIAETD